MLLGIDKIPQSSSLPLIIVDKLGFVEYKVVMYLTI